MSGRFRRDRGFQTPSSNPMSGKLAQAIHGATKREYLLGFDPAFDQRNDNIVTEISLSGNGMKFIPSEHAGDYWEAFLPVHGGQVQIIIRGLPEDAKLERRNTFRGLTRIARKTDARKGETMIITIKVPAQEEPQPVLTHQLKIFQDAPAEPPANAAVIDEQPAFFAAKRGAIGILDLPQEEEAKAA